jgi:hypothetical protein
MWNSATSVEIFAANFTDSDCVSRGYEVFGVVVVEDQRHRQHEHQHEANREVDRGPHEVHVVRQLHAVGPPADSRLLRAGDVERDREDQVRGEGQHADLR